MIPLLLALAILGQDKDAEQLFRKMEEKLLKAETVTGHLATGTGVAGQSMTFAAATGNRVHVKWIEKDGEAFFVHSAVCDGKRLKVDDDERDAPEKLTERVLRAMIRTGVTYAALNGLFTEDKEPEVSGFKKGKREKVGEQDAQAVEFDVALASGAAKATVWIDVKTLLPLKTSLKVGERTFEESYRKLKTGAEVDPKTFELPKK